MRKKKLKVGHILETLMHDDTDYINNDSVKSQSFTDINHRKSNRLNVQTIKNFMFFQTLILMINHKVLIQIKTLSEKVPRIIFETKNFEWPSRNQHESYKLSLDTLYIIPQYYSKIHQECLT